MGGQVTGLEAHTKMSTQRGTLEGKSEKLTCHQVQGESVDPGLQGLPEVKRKDERPEDDMDPDHNLLRDPLKVWVRLAECFSEAGEGKEQNSPESISLSLLVNPAMDKMKLVLSLAPLLPRSQTKFLRSDQDKEHFSSFYSIAWTWLEADIVWEQIG